MLCWEVFALGASPYPDIKAEALILAISRGHRLSRPDACPPDLFAPMPCMMRARHDE